jgi:hypothetical protein
MPYYRNFSKRLIKSPKLYFYDTGLLCYLLEIGSAADLRSHYARGAIFENFCLNELHKNSENAGVAAAFHFWRDSAGHEIDFLVERSGVLYCIEAKSSSTIDGSFFHEIEDFREIAGTQKVKSYLLYAGETEEQRSAAHVVPWRKIGDISAALTS